MDLPKYHDVIGRAYYVSVTLASIMMLVYADWITHKKIHWFIPAAIAVIFSTLIIKTDLIIAGVASLGYVITRIPGPYYWLTQLQLIICLITSVMLLHYGKRRITDQTQKRICSVTYVGFMFIVVVTISIIVLMAWHIHINAAIYVTTAITAFLLILIHSEINHRFLNLLITIPIFGTRFASLIFKLSLNLHKQKTIALRAFTKEMERIIVDCALDYCDGRRQAAADLLGLPLSTYNQKLRNHH
jgi:hypothetical protein